MLGVENSLRTYAKEKLRGGLTVGYYKKTYQKIDVNLFSLNSELSSVF